MAVGGEEAQSSANGQPQLTLASPPGKWVIVATVLGSGIAFLDSTVVNVALPAIRRDLGGGISVQQWVLDGYLLTLGALLLLGGALGDRYGRRRIFLIGLLWFSVASLACGLAPSGVGLIVARIVQGIGAAMLVPGSLALIDGVIDPDDRGRAIGMWAGLSGVSTAIGPFLGGWLVEAVSWRLVFFINLPLAAVAIAVTVVHVPESRDPDATGRMDWTGAAAITGGLAGVTYALIEVPIHGWTAVSVVAVVVGVVGLATFPLVETRVARPMLPLGVFRSRQFTGANLTTLAVYAALGSALFLLTLQLQESLHYSPVAAGLATLPVTVITLVLSPRMGALAQRRGPRTAMTVGPLFAGAGLALMARVTPGTTYATTVLPAVILFGLGLSITVAPLTSTVLASVSEHRAGVASATNNAVARLAGLFAVAVLPAVAGVNTASTGGLGPGYGRAMVISAVLCATGGLVAWVTVRGSMTFRPQMHPAIDHACAEPCTS
jgi:EmrB/QacA subfamily drug resistance transporter